MKKLIFILVVILGVNYQAVAQQIVKEAGSFNTLRVFDKISAELIPSSENRLEISGPKNGDVQVINKNGELKIRMTTLSLLGGEEINVKVYYKEINDLQASEGAVISGTITKVPGLLSLSTKEGAIISVDIDAYKLNARVSTGGEIMVMGQASEQDIVITSGGRYDSKNLESEKATIAINAGGNAAVNASDYVEAKTRAGGTIDIYGGAEVSQKTFAGGIINIY